MELELRGYDEVGQPYTQFTLSPSNLKIVQGGQNASCHGVT